MQLQFLCEKQCQVQPVVKPALMLTITGITTLQWKLTILELQVTVIYVKRHDIEL